MIGEKQIFLKIWTAPRQIFKFINDSGYSKYVTVLLVLAGIANSIGNAVSRNIAFNLPPIGVIGVVVIGGGLMGLITFHIYAHMLKWSGSWVKGKGDFESILNMMAYAMIPSIVAMAILIPQILIYGGSVFQRGFDLESLGTVGITFYWLSNSLEFVLGLWTVALFIIGLSEVQKISIGKSIVNAILPALFIVGPIVLVYYLSLVF